MACWIMFCDMNTSTTWVREDCEQGTPTWLLATHAFDIDERAGFVVDELASKLGTMVGIQAGDVLEERRVVRRVVDSLGVHDDLRKLTRLGEARSVGACIVSRCRQSTF